MQLNLAIPFVGADGKPIVITDQSGAPVVPQLTVGQHIAGIIIQGDQKTNILKIFGWAQKLTANEHIELDVPDAQLFEEIISSGQAIVLLKANVLQALLAAKEK